MKHILLFLCALLFALTGNTAPACNEPEQLLAEARTATNAAGSVSSGELERAMAEARRTMEATGREIERAVAEARRATDSLSITTTGNKPGRPSMRRNASTWPTSRSKS